VTGGAAGPLFGKRVLVTRARDDAADFAAQLRAAGAEALLAPAIAIGPPDDPAAASAAVRELARYDWIVFTSARGVEACFAALGADGGDARRFGGAKVAAIGPKTAEHLSAHGVPAAYVPDAAVGEAVAAGLLARTQAGDRVLVYGAQDMRDVIAEALRARGRVVDVVAAYKTTHVRDSAMARAAEAADVWTFTSASTVRSFAENVPGAAALARTKTVACIGPITAAAARACGLEPDVVAGEFTVEGLLNALNSAGSPRRNTAR